MRIGSRRRLVRQRWKGGAANLPDSRSDIFSSGFRDKITRELFFNQKLQSLCILLNCLSRSTMKRVDLLKSTWQLFRFCAFTREKPVLVPFQLQRTDQLVSTEGNT